MKRIYQERLREELPGMRHVKSDNTRKKAEDQVSQVTTNKKSLIKSSKSSKSSGSRRSRSTISERLIEEKTKLAELKLDAIFIQKKKEHELESERLENQLQIAKAEAKMRIYEGELDILIDELDDNEGMLTSKNNYVEDYVSAHQNVVFDRPKELCESQIPNKEVSIPAGEIKPSTKEEKLPTIPQSKQQDLKLLNDMFGYMQAPTVELDVFSGNALDFEYFMTMFVEAVEKKISDPQSCLTRLLKYLDGEAKELVKGCIHLPPDESFTRAKELLRRRYGDRNRIASQYMKELKNWPKLKSNDSSSFKKFHSFLLKFEASMKSHFIYNSPDVIQILLKKLPSYIQNRWNRQVLKIRKTGEEAQLSNFIQLVDEETTLVDDPLFSHEALTESQDDLKSKTKSRYSSFLSKDETNVNQCPLCTSHHDIEVCPQYLKLSVTERRRLLFQKHLCFCCLQPTSSIHTAKTCDKRKTCSTCGKSHPTSLNGYVKKESLVSVKEPNSFVNGCCLSSESFYSKFSSSISLCIVPVVLSHLSNPEISFNTYALLDNGSQGTFIDIEFLEQIGIQGIQTSLSLKTLHGERTEKCIAVDKLIVTSIQHNYSMQLPRVYSQKTIPVDINDIPSPEKLKRWKYLEPIFNQLNSPPDGTKVSLLIGGNCPKALEPMQVIQSQDGGPYAFRSRLGWCISGPMDGLCYSKKCNAAAVQNEDYNGCSTRLFPSPDVLRETAMKEMLLAMYKHDFNDLQSPINQDSKQYSLEEKQFLNMMEAECTMVDGHYVLPLPFRNTDIMMPNNKYQAIQRSVQLKSKLSKNPHMLKDYTDFMNELLEKNYAIPVNDDNVRNGNVWYIPHHGVYHPKKPRKIRIVFDYSAKYKDIDLNSVLLQGPDLTNQLVGVLTRFREGRVAIVGDIEKMFYQVKVKPEHQDYLRFLWWPNGDFTQELAEFKMTVHLFGAVSSPSCANFALRRTSKQYGQNYDADVSSTLLRNFYVDDMLKSAPNEFSALKLMKDVKELCNIGGFNLTKLGSNSRYVIAHIPEEGKMKGMKDIHLSSILPIERVLGVSWCIESDVFKLRIVLQDVPLIRRGILSSISSIYDPLGFIAPVVLPAKRLLQGLTLNKKGWDESVSIEERQQWEKWRSELSFLDNIEIERSFHPRSFRGNIVDSTLHHFSDASTIGYGQCSYLRTVNDNGEVNCTFLMGKSRVSPIKTMTIPRLELTAATTSIKVSNLLKQELDIVPSQEHYWTDSQVVLGYIHNKTRQFHTFVANRIESIHNSSDVNQWHYVKSEHNPADVASRGIHGSKFHNQSSWLKGPEFLWEKLELPNSESYNVTQEDPEVKQKKIVLLANPADSFLDNLVSRTNNWLKLKRITAFILKWRHKDNQINVSEVERAGVCIIKLVRLQCFAETILCLKTQVRNLKMRNKLVKLYPFVDDEGILRVGGRLQRSSLSFDSMHPIILPKNHPVSYMLITWYHQETSHSGRGTTLNQVRSAGYWVISANSMTRSIISKCVRCRMLRGKLGQQRMADLPIDRVSAAPPFTYCGVDMFGPFSIKERRSVLKKYVGLFTCLASRAVHLESTGSMDSDSFILMLRCFIARRGPIRLMRSDNGTNFVGACNELQRGLKEMQDEKIREFLHKNGADFEWKRNPPHASHMGGAWERHIRSARSIFSSLLTTHGHSLNDESFRTLLTEVEAIINSRPLTVDTLNDVNSPAPLTPNHLLTMKCKVLLPPPGIFQKDDLYCRRR